MESREATQKSEWCRMQGEEDLSPSLPHSKLFSGPQGQVGTEQSLCLMTYEVLSKVVAQTSHMQIVSDGLMDIYTDASMQDWEAYMESQRTQGV